MKKFALLLLAGLSFTFAQAQTKVGLKGGLTYSNIAGDLENEDVYMNKLGFNGGLVPLTAAHVRRLGLSTAIAHARLAQGDDARGGQLGLAVAGREVVAQLVRAQNEQDAGCERPPAPNLPHLVGRLGPTG